MRYSELAFRYASALFDIGSEANKADKYLEPLKSLEKALFENAQVREFIESPLVRATDKEATVTKALEGKGLPAEIQNFILLLARKSRLGHLPEIISAYQAKEDSMNSLTRGTVRSSTELTAKQKEEVAKIVSTITKKKVVLQYNEDKSLIGGLVAQVGSYIFDDSLSAHLRRIKEDLTRRIN
jgi:F-type H+-transporting ATPase subunit delta